MSSVRSKVNFDIAIILHNALINKISLKCTSIEGDDKNFRISRSNLITMLIVVNYYYQNKTG